MIAHSAHDALGHLLRDLAPQVLGVVARRHGDFDAAEDAVQEALISAAEKWPAEGVPANPKGWLYHVAIRRLADQVRSDVARQRREESVATWAASAFVPSPDADINAEEDDTLVLLFMCCHPSLTPASAIALTLRAVGGLTTAEIASAFFVPEATMAQRISRAKQTVKASGTLFALPTDAERAQRLGAVLQALYLIFNEGYASSAGAELHRADLADEAIRLARMARALLPNDGEVAGVLALMLLTDARRAARTGPSGELIPLDEQDRARWNHTQIAEGVALVATAMSFGPAGAYQIQAAIAALHDEAPRVEDTDWPQIVALYTVLEQMTENPMASLSRAIAVAMIDGPAAGLALMDALDNDKRIAGHYRLDAVRGHLLARAGALGHAVDCFRAAAERTLSIPERNYLLLKAARLSAALA